MTIAEIAEQATTLGLIAVGGVTPSVTYHLHHMKLAGEVRVTNPLVPKAAQPSTVPVIDFGI
jgi:hypothetical protein